MAESTSLWALTGDESLAFHSDWLSQKPSRLAPFWTLLLVLALTLQPLDILKAESAQLTRAGIFSDGEWWRLWTAMLIHADFGHWISNLFLIVPLSYFLSGYYGAWLCPILCFLATGFAHLTVLPFYPAHVAIVGASGLVYLMGATWLTLYFLVGRHRPLRGRVLRALGVGALLFLPQEYRPGVAEDVHFFGFVFGIVVGLNWYVLHRAKYQSKEVWIPIPPEDPQDDLPSEGGVLPG